MQAHEEVSRETFSILDLNTTEKDSMERPRKSYNNRKGSGGVLTHKETGSCKRKTRTSNPYNRD